MNILFIFHRHHLKTFTLLTKKESKNAILAIRSRNENKLWNNKMKPSLFIFGVEKKSKKVN